MTKEEEMNPIRYMFNLESAHWYYEDEIVPKKKLNLPHLQFSQFLQISISIFNQNNLKSI